MSGLQIGAPHRRADGVSFAVHVPVESPLFDGHFDGWAILPAVAQLELIATLARSLAPDAPRLATVDRARFRAPVLPGDRLDVHLAPLDTPGDERRLVFRATRAERPVADGAVRMAGVEGAVRMAGVESGAHPIATAGAELEEREPIEVPSLPHGEAARLLECVLERDDAGALCRAKIPARSPFRRGASVPALLAIEMAAQAAGALDERTDGDDGSAPAAMLVSVRDARLFAAELPADERYHVRVRRETANEALLIARFDVALDGWALAAGALTLRAGARA